MVVLNLNFNLEQGGDVFGQIGDLLSGRIAKAISDLKAEIAQFKLQNAEEHKTLADENTQTSADVATLNAAWEDHKTAVNTEIDQINALIKELRDANASGGADQAAVKRITSEMLASTTRIAAIVPDDAPAPGSGDTPTTGDPVPPIDGGGVDDDTAA